MTSVEHLLSQLTLDEKLAMLHQHQPAIERLGLGAFTTGTEALHGLAWLGEATVFPQAIGLGSTWDPSLIRRVAEAVGTEVRGLHAKDPSKCGLNVWAPVVNPLRDPRWGRNEEGYSEDPLLTAIMGEAYSWGLRGDHPFFLRTAPTLKHFLGYNNETDRCTSNSNLPPRVLHEYELPAFRRAIASGAAVAVMASYNLVNGHPAHVTPYINSQLRTWTSDPLFVVSDAYAPSNLADPAQQAFFPDHATSHAAALKAGIDSFTDQDNRSHVTIGRLREGLERGLFDESDVDKAVRRALWLRSRLGEFSADHPYALVSADVINCTAHQELALEAARASVVLLKNDGQLLPLRPGKVAVIGPLADQNHTDWYSGTLPYAVTVRAGLDAALFHEGVDRITLHGLGTFDVFDWGDGVVTLRSLSGKFLRVNEGVVEASSDGPSEWVVREMFRLETQPDGTVHLAHHASPGNPCYGYVQADFSLGDVPHSFEVELVVDGALEAAQLAAEADAVVVVLGNHPLINGRETEDRVSLSLPSAQESLLRRVSEANPATTLVLVSSYPYALETTIPAVVWTSHGGQELGRAVADVLTGVSDPGGRLTQTWYRDISDLPDLFDYDIITSDATYLYYRGTPLYPFGHGLSYTDFAYSDLRLSSGAATAGDTIDVSLTVTNTGTRHGTEVVQLYSHQQESRVKQPLRQLRAFTKLSLAPGESAAVTLAVAVDDLTFWDVTTGGPVLETARHKIMAGRSSADLRLSATLAVHGTVIGTRQAVGRPIQASEDDEYSGIALTASGSTAVENGAWLRFQDVDLSSASHAELMGQGDPVELRVDDPFSGPLLTTAVPGTEQPLSTVDGVHNLYLVFPSAGTTVQGMVFR